MLDMLFDYYDRFFKRAYFEHFMIDFSIFEHILIKVGKLIKNTSFWGENNQKNFFFEKNQFF